MEASPTLKLPTETLAEIFQNYIPTYPLCPPFLGEGSPTRLAHVCRRWRDIALSSRALWRAIHIDGEDSQPDDVSIRQLSFAETWLARSDPLAVSISYSWTNAYLASAASAPQHQVAILAALFAQCHRWQYASLELSEHIPIVPSRAGPIRRMPLLVDLRLMSYSRSTEEALVELDTPRLRRLDARLQSDDNYVVLFGLGVLGGLTHLKLHFISGADACEVLQHCPRLTHCWLCLADAFWDPDADTRGLGSEGLTLPNLTTLVLDVPEGPVPSLEGFLAAVDLPALQRFAIEENLARDGLSAFSDSELDDPYCARALAAAVHRWECRLRALFVLRYECNTVEREVREEYRLAFSTVDRLELLEKDYEERLREEWFA